MCTALGTVEGSEHMSSLRGLNEPLCFVTSKAGFREFGKFFEKLWLNRGEVETRFALHTFFQLRRNAFEQFRKGVNRHQVKTNIRFPSMRGSEEHRLLVLHDVVGVEIIVARFVAHHFQLLRVRLENRRLRVLSYTTFAKNSSG